MTPKLIELHRQRGRLQERIAQQRTAVAVQLKPVLDAERLAQRSLNVASDAVQQLKAHPWPLALAVAALALAKPRRVWRGLRLGVWVWRRYRNLRDWVPASVWAALVSKR